MPAVLAQVEHDLRADLTLAASGRFDDHNRYGARFSPRLSVLYRPGPWSLRTSIGQGFFAPTPFVEGIDEVGLSRLMPLGGLKAETATSVSFDAGYAAGPLQLNLTLFGSEIKHAIQLRKFAIPGVPNTQLINAASPTRTGGVELKLRYAWDSFIVTGSYVYTDATEADPSGIGRAACR